MASAVSSTASCSAQRSPGSTILGFRSIPSGVTPCIDRSAKTALRTSSVKLPAAVDRMIALHEHFRPDDRHEHCFLAQGGVAGQSLRVRFNATPAGNGTHLKVFFEAVAQPVQAYGDFLVRMSGRILLRKGLCR